MSDFLVGQVVRVTGTFKNAAGVKADPSNVMFKFEDPAGTIIQYTYLTDAELVKASTGVYYVDINAHLHETWRWRFWSTGGGKAAQEGSFTVEKSQFS